MAVAAVSLYSRAARAADPSAGDCVDANDRAIALEMGGRLLDARSHLAVCSSAACPMEIRRDCARRVEELNAAMPTIVFDVKDQKGNDLEGCHVMMDGRPLLGQASGAALAVDPGPHDFAFQASGFVTLHRRFVLHQGEKNRREAITLDAASPPEDVSASGAGVPSRGGSSSGGTASRGSASPSVSLPAMLVATAGFAAIGVGITILAFGFAEESRAEGEDRLAVDFGHSAHVAAQNDAIAGAIVTGCGLIAAGAGVVLAVRSSASRPVAAQTPTRAVALSLTPVLGPSGLRLFLNGSFR